MILTATIHHTQFMLHHIQFHYGIKDILMESGADIHLLLHQFSSCRRIYFAGLLWRSDQIIDILYLLL